MGNKQVNVVGFLKVLQNQFDFACKLCRIKVVQQVEVQLMSTDYLKGRAILTDCNFLHYLVNHNDFRINALQVTPRKLKH